MDIPEGLRFLAQWIDAKYPNDKRPEVQADLRRWADDIEALRRERDAVRDAILLDAETIKEQCDADEYCEWPTCACMDQLRNSYRSIRPENTGSTNEVSSLVLQGEDG